MRLPPTPLDGQHLALAEDIVAVGFQPDPDAGHSCPLRPSVLADLDPPRSASGSAERTDPIMPPG